METTIFNPMQVHLLQMFALDDSKDGLAELKNVLYQHYSTRLNDKLNNLWLSGKLSQQRLDEINQMDLHQKTN
ncbi:MAG: hypothetical protein IJ605_00285 [Prevotella sp.]|nr:hypothetical protein [Prevotella sp.]